MHIKSTKPTTRTESESGPGIFEYAEGLSEPATKEELTKMQMKRTLSPRKDSGINIEFNMPEKEEILYQDPDLDFKEYEDFIMINGEKL